MNTNSKIPAGLLDDSFEFFEKDGKVYFLHNKQTHDFMDLDVNYATLLRMDLDEHPRAVEALNALGISDPIDQLKQWAICNFGNFDMKTDLSADGELIKEYVSCHKRGKCEYEGIICPPVEAGNGTLTKREIQIIKLIVQDLLDKTIADRLSISIATMNVHRGNIERKIGCHSKAGIVAFAYQHNLI